MPREDITPFLNFIDIGTKSNVNILRWQTHPKIFMIDIVTARKEAKEKSFKHNETTEKKNVFIQKGELVFLISAQPKVQFQMLEAILETIMKIFFETYGELAMELITGGMVDGFLSQIPDIIKQVQKEGVKWITTRCAVCEQNVTICIKKNMIINAKSLPVACVFIHEGHGLVVYIDKDYQVRGAENVDLTG